MIRVILTELILFLMPVTIYLAWMWYRARYADSHGGEVPKLEKGPWPLLLFIGALLALAAMGYMGLTKGSGAGADYIPARIENGRIVPGRLVGPDTP